MQYETTPRFVKKNNAGNSNPNKMPPTRSKRQLLNDEKKNEKTRRKLEKNRKERRRKRLAALRPKTKSSKQDWTKKEVTEEERLKAKKKCKKKKCKKRRELSDPNAPECWRACSSKNWVELQKRFERRLNIAESTKKEYFRLSRLFHPDKHLAKWSVICTSAMQSLNKARINTTWSR